MKKKGKVLVIKIGTTSLTKGTHSLCKQEMLRFVEELVSLREEGHQVLLVTSGAIAAGRELLGNPKVERSLPSKQMFASVGQSYLMNLWSELFALFKIHVGQILLTREDFNDRQRYLNIRSTLSSLLSQQVIPIINENDTVATDEIKVGDNDTLSALVASLIAADQLILLTDQPGLYTANPDTDPKAELIPVVKKIDDSIRALAGGTRKTLGLGTGGMGSKVQAAYLASQNGIPTLITSLSTPHLLKEIVQGKKVGTLFLAETSFRESHKRWLISKKPQGILFLDQGAQKHVCQHGASLLPVGIAKIEGSFSRGATLELRSLTNQQLAVGISNYSSEEIQQLLGIQSEMIEEILGYSYGEEVIHRDQMALLHYESLSSN